MNPVIKTLHDKIREITKCKDYILSHSFPVCPYEELSKLNDRIRQYNVAIFTLQHIGKAGRITDKDYPLLLDMDMRCVPRIDQANIFNVTERTIRTHQMIAKTNHGDYHHNYVSKSIEENYIRFSPRTSNQHDDIFLMVSNVPFFQNTYLCIEITNHRVIFTKPNVNNQNVKKYRVSRTKSKDQGRVRVRSNILLAGKYFIDKEDITSTQLVVYYREQII